MKKSIFIIMASCAVLFGCGSHGHDSGQEHEHEHEHEEEHAHEGHSHAGETVMDTHRQEELGVSTWTVEPGEFSEVIHTSGQIASAIGDETTVVARTSGIVSLGRLTEGAAIGKGAVIATVSSRDIGSGDQLAKARSTYENALKEYERDLQLREDNIVSESHLDKSKLAYEIAKAEYDALGGGSPSSGVTVTAPLGGFVKKLYVRHGDYVETGQPLATVSQNKRLSLRADVPEKDYGMVGLVTDANFKTASSSSTYSLSELGGRLVSYGRTSSEDFYIPVTFEFDNKGDIVPGSYVEVFLKTTPLQSCITVPVEAVMEDQGVRYVFVRHESDSFLRREVEVGTSDGRKVLVRKGLEAGDEVVVSGAVHVKLASVTAVPSGHTHNH
jgi:RND family efflux transporter MFP subunit